MDELRTLGEIYGKGTSMITFAISYSPNALNKANELLNNELSISSNIKCKV